MIFSDTLISLVKDEEYRELFLTTLVIISFGTVVYRYLEGWNWVDSFYFSVITLTTVGYGDFSPVTDAGKLFTVFYIFIGIGIILSFIDTIQQHYSNYKTKND